MAASVVVVAVAVAETTSNCQALYMKRMVSNHPFFYSFDICTTMAPSHFVGPSPYPGVGKCHFRTNAK